MKQLTGFRLVQGYRAECSEWCCGYTYSHLTDPLESEVDPDELPTELATVVVAATQYKLLAKVEV
jgi:hypothetical protein